MDDKVERAREALERLEDILPRENKERKGPLLASKPRRSKGRRDAARKRRARRK